MSSPTNHPTKFEAVVLGSGFAGSLTALILAKSGMRVALVDRATHPRFAIGESSTPAADYLLHQLCVQYNLSSILPLCRYGSWRKSYPDVRCGCKRGFSYVWHGSGHDYHATPQHDCELLVTASASEEVADTQWYRSDVDKFFFQQCVDTGVDIFEQAELIEVRPLDASTGGWRLVLDQLGSHHQLQAEFVVDASGPSSRFLQQQTPQDCTDRLLTRTSAIYTHLYGSGLTQDWLVTQGAWHADFPYDFDLAAVHHLFRDEGWLWQIGFDDQLTSVGFVRKLATNAPGLASQFSTEEQAMRAWKSMLGSHPVLREVLGEVSSLKIARMPGRVFESPRLQRLTVPAGGKDWAALPFTIGFIDPLHSTGIAHSLSGVERICRGLLAPTQSERNEVIQKYADDVVGELLHIDQMIAGCYDSLSDFRLFNCWTMIYFAAATTFERLHRDGQSPSFLLSGDSRFRQIVYRCRQLLGELLQSELSHSGAIRDSAGEPRGNSKIDDYIAQVRELLVPYNAVGLFAPRVNNMYWHTAAK